MRACCLSQFRLGVVILLLCVAGCAKPVNVPPPESLPQPSSEFDRGPRNQPEDLGSRSASAGVSDS